MNDFDFRKWTDIHEAWTGEFHYHVCGMQDGLLTHIICDGRDHYSPVRPTKCERLAIEEVEYRASVAE